MRSITFTRYEISLLMEALTRAAARRNSMSKSSDNDDKVREHAGVAEQMIALLTRLERIKEAA